MFQDQAVQERDIEEAEAEQARLAAELDVLRARVRTAEEERRRASDDVDERLAAVSAAARAELDALDACHRDTLAAVRASAEAEAEALLAEAGVDGTSATRAHPREGR